MRRDMDLVRKILLWADEQPNGYTNGNPDIEGRTDEEVGYHVLLMWQAGLVDAIDTTGLSSTSPTAQLNYLTWAGHDFLEAVRDDTLWKKAKATVLKPAAGAAFDVLLTWAKKQALEGLGLS